MTAAVQDELSVFLDAVAYPATPGRISDRAAIVAAVRQDAARNRNLVHISRVRPLLPAWCTGNVVGATISALVSAGFLRPTGGWLPNGDAKGKNAAKPAHVYRLMAAIPASWAETNKS